MLRQEDVDTALAQAVDQAVHPARRDGVETRGRLVEKEDGRIVE
jgi:hypothetical protein